MTRFKDQYRVESARLPAWDYAAAGLYFVTICTRAGEPCLGWIEQGQMQLAPCGEIARQCWEAIPRHTAGMVSLDAYVIMPNHVHGIIVIQEPASTPAAGPIGRQQSDGEREGDGYTRQMANISPRAGSLGAIVRSYKAAVTHLCRQNGIPFCGWQTRYYDRIIRHERVLYYVRRYIQNNPARWENDHQNPHRK